MKQKKIFYLFLASVLFLLISTIYSVLFNNSRLVVPTDFSTFQLTLKDLPMIVSLSCFCITFLYILFCIFFCIFKRKKELKKFNKTRKINPRIGMLGFLGFLGFFGIHTLIANANPSPFVFFTFFGFFGFYYEGKLSDTLIDEMYEENRKKATFKAYNIGFNTIFILVLVAPHIYRNYLGAVLLIALSLIIALVIFLQEYFIYYYENKVEEVETKR